MSRLSDHGWHFGVEGPARYQILHGHGIVARAQAVLQIKLMCRFHCVHVQLDAQTWCRGDIDHAALDLQRLFREVLPILPNPMRVNGRDFARRCRSAVREHGQRNIKVVVGM